MEQKAPTMKQKAPTMKPGTASLEQKTSTALFFFQTSESDSPCGDELSAQRARARLIH
jgi:hypothetical protein